MAIFQNEGGAKMKDVKRLALMVLALCVMVCSADFAGAAPTKLLLHCDGADGSQIFSDDSPSSHNITAYGDAQVDTATLIFGTGSLLLDGDGDYLTSADSADWDISTDFTIDLWVKHTDHVGDELYVGQTESNVKFWMFARSDDVDGIKFRIYDNGDVVYLKGGAANDITDTNQHHLAMCKVGNEYGIYKDGTQIAYTSDANMAGFTGILNIGAWKVNGVGNYFDGHIDEIRISHYNEFGAAPKSDNTDTITVPDGPYSDVEVILSLGVNNNPMNSITLELGRSCTFELLSDNSYSYNARVGFDDGLSLGSFTHIETRPEAGDLADVTDYNVIDFGGFDVSADGSAVLPSAGVHFVFQYTAQQLGETDLKLYDATGTSLIDSVHITVMPVPMESAFTYQGRLLDADEPADEFYDFQFQLYDTESDGNQIGDDVNISNVDVIDGYFTVELNFGSSVFTGNARWLGIGVRPGDSNDVYTTLSPRQKVTPAPQAVYAATAGAVHQPGGGGQVPEGGIIMWSGAINDIPHNWALCDGTNGTPDLTSRFIRSVPNSSTDPGSTGGSLTHSHAPGSYSASSHVHPFSVTTSTPSTEYCCICSCGTDRVAGNDHRHTFSGSTDLEGGGDISGTSGGASSLPTYYELAFIMRL
jgi:hypothetical protein